MKKLLFIIALSFLLNACGIGRWSSEFELDEKSFDEEVMEYIEETAELDLPEGSRGLNFYYKPPIDPNFIAKIEIPKEGKDAIKKQFEAFETQGEGIGRISFAKKEWFKKVGEKDEVEVYFKGGSNCWVRAFMVKEGERLILYVEYVVV